MDAVYVGADEIRRARMDAPIHMRLGRKIDNVLRFVFFIRRIHRPRITNIALHKRIPPIFLHIKEIVGVSAIGKLVKIHHPDAGVSGKEMADEVGSDKPRSSGYKNCTFPETIHTDMITFAIHSPVSDITRDASQTFFCKKIERSCRVVTLRERPQDQIQHP